MHVLRIMDRTGDTRHEFDPADLASIAEAEKRFMELTGSGFTAAAKDALGPGEHALVREFDPTVLETLFIPRLVGG